METKHYKNNIRAARVDRGLTQEAVALDLGVTRQTYGRYEAGERECGYDTLRTLAAMFGVSIDYLLCTDAETVPSAKEARMLKLFRAIPAHEQAAVMQMIESFYHVTHPGLSSVERRAGMSST